MTDLDLDHIERLTNAATPGPWTTGADKKWSDALPSWALIISPGYPLIELDDGPQGAADAEFIAAARTAVPKMVAKIREQAAEIDRLRADSAEAHTQCRRLNRELDDTRADLAAADEQITSMRAALEDADAEVTR